MTASQLVSCHQCNNVRIDEKMHNNCIKLYNFFPCSEPNLLVRACNQLGQFLQHRETNLRYLALESMCTLASSEFSHEAVKTHIETVINALKVCIVLLTCNICILTNIQCCLYSMTENGFLFHLFKSNRWLFICLYYCFPRLRGMWVSDRGQQICCMQCVIEAMPNR